ncbi:MAG TPA: cytochrome c oxidase subunit II [Candidatus Limnocylindria bacterium]|nr:cytochrome c oxidase subunit II [Candidatus Limnocylindria bacterium]
MRTSAEAIGGLALVVGAIAFLIFIGVEAALLYSAWRYRASRVAGPAPQIHGNTRLEIAWTAIPLVVLAVVFVLMVGTMREIGATASANGPAAMRIVARGHQWWWEFRYPDASGEIVTANELHIPSNTAVDLELVAADVVHSFWVPELGGKTDMIPGKTNHLRLYADHAGVYRGQCAEFCGIEHAWMRISVVAESAGDFQRWLAGQAAARAAPGGTAAEGERVFLQNVCASCHAVRGTDAKAVAGPDLTHLASRRTLAAGVLPNDTASLRAWLFDPQRYKPGSLMPRVPLSDADLDALVSYLGSLR